MHDDITATTATTAHRRAARRCLAVAGGLLVSVVAIGAGVARTAASPATDHPLCSWRPVADDIQVGIGLLGTVRFGDDGPEVLHHVTCSDGTSRDAWMAAVD